MQAIIEVYAAVDKQPLRALERDFHVTHLLVDRRHVERPPSYFSPFAEELTALRSSRGDQPLFLSQAIETAGVFRVGDLVLLDLSRL
jgi:hypothetical protein